MQPYPVNTYRVFFMSEEQNPAPRKPRAPRKPAARKARPSAAATHARKAKYSDAMIAAARAMWEGDPRISKAAVAEEMGIPYAMVDKWSKGGASGTGEKWCKRVDEGMSERAHAIADTYREKLTEFGDEPTIEQKKQAQDETVEDIALKLRAELIGRHRQEWSAIRNLLYKGMKQAADARGFEASKFAKISAETMKIMQEAERRSWGIDSGPDGQTKVQVVIERE